MASNAKKEEPCTAPKPDRWYNLTLGSSFKDHHPSSKFCTLRYEFKPASIDKNQAGSLHKNKDNRVSVEFHNNQPRKQKVTFEGSSEDYKDNDAVLFFDGQTFRLERLHRAVKRLRHVRLPGESAAAATSLGPAAESGSSPVNKVAKFQPLNKSIPLSMPVEIERIEIGDFKSLDTKSQNGKVVTYPSADPPPSTASADLKSNDLAEQVDVMNHGDEVDESGNVSNNVEKEFHTGIDINLPHQNDSDEEIADVDVNDDEDKGCNAAEALRAQVNAEERAGKTSSSSGSSGSGSDSSGSGSGSSSSDSESSDGDSVNSI